MPPDAPTPRDPAHTSPESALAKLGHRLPPAPRPVAAYIPSKRSGNLVFVSGQLPFLDGKLLAKGSVPGEVSPSDATAAAAQCALNALAVLRAEVGELSRVRSIVRIGVFVSSDPGFEGQPAIANGASELLVQVFGEAGRHARAAVGASALPLGACVEVELVAEVE